MIRSGWESTIGTVTPTALVTVLPFSCIQPGCPSPQKETPSHWIFFLIVQFTEFILPCACNVNLRSLGVCKLRKFCKQLSKSLTNVGKMLFTICISLNKQCVCVFFLSRQHGVPPWVWASRQGTWASSVENWEFWFGGCSWEPLWRVLHRWCLRGPQYYQATLWQPTVWSPLLAR